MQRVVQKKTPLDFSTAKSIIKPFRWMLFFPLYITNLEDREFLPRGSATIGSGLFRWSGELPVANPGSGFYGMSMAIQIQSQKPLVVRLVDRVEAFHALKDRWNELSDASVYPNIFSTWEWCSIWWKWYGEKELHGKLFLVLIESDDQLVGLFPLYLLTKGIPGINRTRTLHFIGYGARPTGEYWGPIIRKDWGESVCDAALDFFQNQKAEWDSFFFESYALDDPGTVAFAQKMKEVFLSYSQEDEERFYITLPKTYDDYLNSLSRVNRQGKRRRLKLANNRYRAVLRQIDETQLGESFPVFVELYNQSRERLGQVSPYKNDDYRQFQQEILKTLIPLKMASLLIMDYGEYPVSMFLTYDYQGRCFFYQTGLSSNNVGSPGDVILQHRLMLAIEEKYSEFDFLRGGEWYKSLYTDVGRKTEMLVLFSGKNKSYFLTFFANHFYRPMRRSAKRMLLSLLVFFHREKTQESHEREGSDDSNGKTEV